VQLVLLVLVGWGIYRSLAPELARLRAHDLLQYRPAILPLVVSTVLLVAVYLLHAWLWRAIAVALSGDSLSIRSAMRVYFLSSLGRYLPGKLWQVAGLGVLAQREGFSPVGAIASSLVAQLAFLSTGVVFLALLLPALLRGASALAALGLLAFALLAFVIVATRLGQRLRQRILSRFGPRVTQASILLDQLNVRRTLGWWTIYASSWLLLGLAFALFVTAFAPAPFAQYRLFAGVVAASYLSGYILFTPAGIGVREGVMMTLLATTLPASAALFISIVSRLWFTAGELLPMALIPLLPRAQKQAPGGEVS
jgi:hypothetical protein